jgi:hypothetical protein
VGRSCSRVGGNCRDCIAIELYRQARRQVVGRSTGS